MQINLSFFRAETRKVAMENFMSGSNPDVIDGVMRDKYAAERDNRHDMPDKGQNILVSLQKWGLLIMPMTLHKVKNYNCYTYMLFPKRNKFLYLRQEKDIY